MVTTKSKRVIISLTFKVTLLSIAVFFIACKSKMVPVQFNYSDPAEMTSEEAWSVIEENGLDVKYPYNVEVKEYRWIKDMNGNQFRKSEFVVKTFYITFNELTKQENVTFQCYLDEKTSDYDIKSTFIDREKRKASLRILKTEEREKAKEILRALNRLIQK